MIWPHREGVAAYRSMTRTLEYAPDGIDFMAKPLMEPAPAEPRLAAPGCFRLDLTEPVEFGEGISWGIAARDQNAIKDKGKRTPYLARYEVDLVVSER